MYFGGRTFPRNLSGPGAGGQGFGIASGLADGLANGMAGQNDDVVSQSGEHITAAGSGTNRPPNPPMISGLRSRSGGFRRLVLGRLAPYAPRLDATCRLVQDGQQNMFTGVMCGSFHDVWMELHEDLILTQGIDRSAEGSF